MWPGHAFVFELYVSFITAVLVSRFFEAAVHTNLCGALKGSLVSGYKTLFSSNWKLVWCSKHSRVLRSSVRHRRVPSDTAPALEESDAGGSLAASPGFQRCFLSVPAGPEARRDAPAAGCNAPRHTPMLSHTLSLFEAAPPWCAGVYCQDTNKQNKCVPLWRCLTGSLFSSTVMTSFMITNT